MQMFNGGEHCPLCRMVIDIHGHHVFACMCGGDKVLEHNEIRNEVHRVAKVAGAQPELEAGGLLGGLGWPGVAGRRPADTLLVAARGGCVVRLGGRLLGWRLISRLLHNLAHMCCVYLRSQGWRLHNNTLLTSAAT